MRGIHKLQLSVVIIKIQSIVSSISVVKMTDSCQCFFGFVKRFSHISAGSAKLKRLVYLLLYVFFHHNV